MVDPNNPNQNEFEVSDEQLHGFVDAVRKIQPFADEVTELTPDLEHCYIYTSPHIAARVIIERQIQGEFDPEDIFSVESIENTIEESGQEQQRITRFRVSSLDSDPENVSSDYSDESYVRATPADTWTDHSTYLFDMIRSARQLAVEGREQESDELFDKINALAEQEAELNKLIGTGPRSLATYLSFTAILSKIHAELGITPTE